MLVDMARVEQEVDSSEVGSSGKVCFSPSRQVPSRRARVLAIRRVLGRDIHGVCHQRRVPSRHVSSNLVPSTRVQDLAIKVGAGS